jgi:hypothetical protein
MISKEWLLGKIGSALYVAALVGVGWSWQYTKFSHGYGLFSHFGRYGFLVMVVCHVAIFCVGLRIMWGGSEPTDGQE